MYKRNKATHQPFKIKPLCHLKISETSFPVTWYYFSGQRPQLQHYKSHKTCNNYKRGNDATHEDTHNNFMYKVTLNPETYWIQHQHFCFVQLQATYSFR